MKKHTKKSTNIEIVIPILNNEYKVIVLIGDNKYASRVAKLWNYKEAIGLEDCQRGACFSKSNVHPIIVLRKFPKTPEEIGTLAHEAVHAITAIWFNIDEKTTDSETFAHSVGAVVRHTLERVHKEIYGY